MPRTLDPNKAREVTKIVLRLDGAASFRNILREAAELGILKEHKTLRRYLNLLVRGNVLRVRMLDVGSVYPKQIHSVKLKNPQVWVGLAVLRKHGLNWDVPDTEMHIVSTDFEGLTRSHDFDSVLGASLEDSLIHELYRDAKKNTSTSAFVISVLATKKLDLPYLLRRADEMRVGRATRLAFTRILEVTSSRETEVAASIFLAVRTQFLNIVRQYTRSGLWKLVERKGVGNLGLRMIRHLSEHDIMVAAGKQLGVTG